MKPLALNIPTFDRLREGGYLYVDKTREVYQMVRPGAGMYFFLARPRRFGKSLLVSTLEMLFEGRKELFEGLYIYDKIDWEKWGSYPVVRLNFSEINNAGSKEDFTKAIIRYLRFNYAKKYGIDLDNNSKDLKGYFGELAQEINLKTGKRIALFIDEYDKPILDHVADNKKAEENQKVLHGFYDFIKNASRFWQIVFVTGISKFSKMSLFSAMNNLLDLSGKPVYNSLPGFTEKELQANFADYIQLFAERLGVDIEEMMVNLRHYYNGYSWTGDERVYNPFSVINAFEDMELNKYWYNSGTPSMLIPFLKKKNMQQPTNKNALDFENIEVTDDFFRSSDLENVTAERLLFQTGYLTVKGSHRIGLELNYFLGYPNFEVRWSFMTFLQKSLWIPFAPMPAIWSLPWKLKTWNVPLT